MKVHLVDGTYELFRAYFGAPPAMNRSNQEVGATRGVLRTLQGLLTFGGATHVAIAFDTVIESFRNQLFAGYKTGDGIEPALRSQFPIVERACEALGITVWRMIDFEADDALATGAARYAADAAVEQVVICSPDKDLAQCLRGERIVRLDRMRQIVLDEAGLKEKLGIPPGSVPDWLALVGDTSDGIPGIPRWGEKSASAVLGVYEKLEAIPDEARAWKRKVRGAEALATSLAERRPESLLYRTLATLRTDVPLTETVADLEWKGADRARMQAMAEELEDSTLIERITPLALTRGIRSAVASARHNPHNDGVESSMMKRTVSAILLALISMVPIGVVGCGSATPQVTVTPMTPESETAFENGIDFIDDPSLLEGSWLDNWESDVEHRVTLSDAIAVVHITTVRRDTDLERHDTYHLVAAVDNIRFGTMPTEVSLAARQGEGGFGTIDGNDERLLNLRADHPDHFLLYLKWTQDEGGTLVARWHLSPAGTPVVQRVNSLIEMRRQAGDTRRRIIVHTTTETEDDESQ